MKAKHPAAVALGRRSWELRCARETPSQISDAMAKMADLATQSMTAAERTARAKKAVAAREAKKKARRKAHKA